MSDKPYSDADVKLAAAAISAYDYENHVSANGEIGRHQWNEARAVLDALTTAGRLLPAGTKTRIEWATRLKAHTENGTDYAEELVPVSASLAKLYDATEEQYANARAEHWRRRFGDELVDVVRRDIHTTPWAEAKP